MALDDDTDDTLTLERERGDFFGEEKPAPTPEANAEVDEELKKLEEDPEAKKEEEQPRDEKGKFAKKEHGIPKERFDEAVGKERAAREAAERRAAELEAQVRKEQQDDTVAKMEKDVEALEAKHAKLLLDGEHEAAAKVMKEIRLAERNIARYESDDKVSRATAQAVEQVRMDATIARLESDYPVLNQDSELYDQDLVDLVLAEQGRLIRAERLPPSEALARAGVKIMKKFERAGAAPEPDKKPEPAGLGAAKGSERKSDQVSKNMDTAKRQPPNMKDAGLDSDKRGAQEGIPDISRLSDEEFAALPEATKAKMRGDFV